VCDVTDHYDYACPYGDRIPAPAPGTRHTSGRHGYARPSTGDQSNFRWYYNDHAGQFEPTHYGGSTIRDQGGTQLQTTGHHDVYDAILKDATTSFGCSYDQNTRYYDEQAFITATKAPQTQQPSQQSDHQADNCTEYSGWQSQYLADLKTGFKPCTKVVPGRTGMSEQNSISRQQYGEEVTCNRQRRAMPSNRSSSLDKPKHDSKESPITVNNVSVKSGANNVVTVNVVGRPCHKDSHVVERRTNENSLTEVKEPQSSKKQSAVIVTEKQNDVKHRQHDVQSEIDSEDVRREITLDWSPLNGDIPSEHRDGQHGPTADEQTGLPKELNINDYTVKNKERTNLSKSKLARYQPLQVSDDLEKKNCNLSNKQRSDPIDDMVDAPVPVSPAQVFDNFNKYDDIILVETVPNHVDYLPEVNSHVFDVPNHSLDVVDEDPAIDIERSPTEDELRLEPDEKMNEYKDNDNDSLSEIDQYFTESKSNEILENHLDVRQNHLRDVVDNTIIENEPDELAANEDTTADRLSKDDSVDLQSPCRDANSVSKQEPLSDDEYLCQLIASDDRFSVNYDSEYRAPVNYSTTLVGLTRRRNKKREIYYDDDEFIENVRPRRPANTRDSVADDKAANIGKRSGDNYEGDPDVDRGRVTLTMEDSGYQTYERELSSLGDGLPPSSTDVLFSSPSPMDDVLNGSNSINSMKSLTRHNGGAVSLGTVPVSLHSPSINQSNVIRTTSIESESSSTYRTRRLDNDLEVSESDPSEWNKFNHGLKDSQSPSISDKDIYNTIARQVFLLAFAWQLIVLFTYLFRPTAILAHRAKTCCKSVLNIIFINGGKLARAKHTYVCYI